MSTATGLRSLAWAARRRPEPLQPTAQRAPHRNIAQDHDRVAGLHRASPRSEQVVVHLLGRPVRPPEDAQRHGVAEVEIAPQPDARVVVLLQFARAHTSRRGEQLPQALAFL